MPWTPYTNEGAISGSSGVYEIADAEGRTLYLGSAGAKDLFGLRGRIADHFREDPNAAQNRYEVTSAYLSRWIELLGRYQQTHGGLPPGNIAGAESLPALPRFGRS